MTWLAVIYTLSTGLIEIKTTDEAMCMDTLLEAQFVFGRDLWSAVCTADGQDYVSIPNVGSVGP